MIYNRKSKQRMYGKWASMRQRCNCKTYKQYDDYGGRGIKVCERWDSFENFCKDMGDPPTPESTLDRIDNNKSYSLDNCQWVTMKVQSNNKRDNRYLTYKGKTQSMQMWCEEIGMNKTTFRSRLESGWSMETIMTTPVKRYQ